MERREGAVIKNRHPMPPEIDARPETFRRISESLIDTLADLHAADYEKIGLGGLGRPEGFLQRQITGWMGRWEKAKTREVPLMEKLGTWFLEHMPAAQKPTLLHNDFYLHNVMLAAGDSGKVVGVFDWEMSTLGDPMIDLGLTMGYWRQADDPPELIALSQGYAHTTAPGFLSRDEMTERYARRSGRDLSMVDYYRRGPTGRPPRWSSRFTCATCADRPTIRALPTWANGRRCWRGRRRESLPNSALGSKSQVAIAQAARRATYCRGVLLAGLWTK